MDLNTVSSVVHTADPRDWRPGDAWLAGGTVLFSAGTSELQRLLDITKAGWEPLTVSTDGLEISATCTVSTLYAFPAEPDPHGAASGQSPAVGWPALNLIRACCDAFVASFKVWNVSTVGGNICTALPAGPMTALTAALDSSALILSPDGTSRRLPVTALVIGEGSTALAPGELLRSITVPAAALRARTASRQVSLTTLGRSGALLIGRRDEDGGFVLTVTAATVRPVQLRFAGMPAAAELRSSLAGAIPAELYLNDVHGLPAWRHYITGRLAEEIRTELAA
ncbi:CO/xanthine dehydrogenase FAD-binding subunit [Arthrobacter sp. UYP6]|uniref:FAD binding domain-containing protein n=1 Tax=Arthrobacter sp. UYP6 TaxID=1756378 RepID=UPI0033963B50